MKSCSICKKRKPYSDFTRSKQNSTGYGSWCRACCRQKRQEHKQNLSPEARDAERKRQNDYHRLYSQRPDAKIKRRAYDKRHYERQVASGEVKPQFRHISTREGFIERANERHRGFYSYEKVKFTPRSPLNNWKGEANRKTSEYYRDEKIIITCPIHGDFVQTARKHIEKHPSGCGKCATLKRFETINKKYPNGIERHAHTTESFIEKSNAIWGEGTWDYSRVEYKLRSVVALNYVEIGCPVHGFFKQLPTNHYRYGCRRCSDIKKGNDSRMSIETLLTRLSEVHGDKYEYSHLRKNWTGYSQRVQDGADRHNRGKKYEISCKKHGIFMMDMRHHLLRAQGCPRCSPTLSHGEKLTRAIFERKYPGYKFDKCRPDWLINPQTNYHLELDGYNEELKLAFEYQGDQHYEPVKMWGGEKTLRAVQYRDQIKREMCKARGITLIEIDARPLRNRSFSKRTQLIENQLKLYKL